MTEVSERAENRLDNLNNIEPLLGSLRILSLSTLQMSLNRKENLYAYKNEYDRILSQLIAALPKKTSSEKLLEKGGKGKKILVVLGSERGICGTYNKNLAGMAATWQTKQVGSGAIISFGARVQDALKKMGLIFEHQGSISQGSKPHYQKAYSMINIWLKEFNDQVLKSVEVLSFRKPSGTTYKAVITPLIPAHLNMDYHRDLTIEWPPTIIEGDPLIMIKRTIEHLTTIKFYDLILDSISAENAVRYNLLEEAKENTRELIEELTIEIQIIKRQTITQQIQEMAAGAGLTR